jgi:hypothetical protein
MIREKQIKIKRIRIKVDIKNQILRDVIKKITIQNKIYNNPKIENQV